jgi:hypothetical protein
MKTNGAKVEPVVISSDVPSWFDRISKDNWIYSYGTTNNYLKEYRLLVPNLGADDPTDKDREIRYDYEGDIWSEHSYATNANVIAAVVNEDTGGTWNDETRTWDDIDETWSSFAYPRFTRFYTGDYTGYIREHDRVESDEDGTAQAINSYVVTKPLNLSEEKEDVDKNKRLLKMRARMKSFTGSTVTVEKKEDNEPSFQTVNTIDCEQTNNIFEAEVDMSGMCKELQYRIGNNAVAQPWTLYWLLTEYLIKGDK